MPDFTRRQFSLTAAASLAMARPSWAQTPTPYRLRATIESVAADSLTLTARSGEKVTVALAADAAVNAIVPVRLEDIKPGSFVGSGAVPGADGTLRALEVHVFPENMRGRGEGHRPFDLQPESTMTNGTVGTVTGGTDRTLTVSYKGGEKTIVVGATTPVVTYEDGSRALLTAGAHVILFGTQGADGKITANRISVGKDGLVPPM